MTKRNLARADRLAKKTSRFVKRSVFLIKLSIFGLIALCIINTGLQTRRYISTHTFIPQSPVILKFQPPIKVIDNEMLYKKTKKIVESKSTPKPVKAIKPTISPFSKYITNEANMVREKVLVYIKKDFDNIDDQVAMDNIQFGLRCILTRYFMSHDRRWMEC